MPKPLHPNNNLTEECVPKPVWEMHNKLVDERCMSHEKRICGMERKLNGVLITTIGILAAVITQLTLYLIQNVH